MKKANSASLLTLDKRRITKLTNLQIIRGGGDTGGIDPTGKTTDRPQGGGGSSRRCVEKGLDTGTSENCKSSRACS